MDHAWLAPSLNEVYGRIAATFKPIRGASSQLLVQNEAKPFLLWQMIDTQTTHTRKCITSDMKWEGWCVSIWTVHRSVSSSLPIFFSLYYQSGMFSVSIRICLEQNPFLIKPKLHVARAETCRMDELLDGYIGGCVRDTSSDFNMPFSHIFACFNMNSYLWKGMNSKPHAEHYKHYWLQRWVAASICAGEA